MGTLVEDSFNLQSIFDARSNIFLFVLHLSLSNFVHISPKHFILVYTKNIEFVYVYTNVGRVSCSS
jgi:hypothetical protein